jgi:hypothetical protein
VRVVQFAARDESVLQREPIWKEFGAIGSRKVRLAAAERRNFRLRASSRDLGAGKTAGGNL